MIQERPAYAARLNIDYQDGQNKLTTFFRPITIIPIAIVAGAISAGLGFATALMVVFRQKYPRWWFDFSYQMACFTTRIGAYAFLLTDVYPSTTDEQSVHLEMDYPDAEHGLNRWMPLVKWLLAIPHYFVLLVLAILAFFGLIVAWFTILFTGRYPRSIHEYMVGLMRWGLRVEAYMYLQLTDVYPPFSME
jgi:multisubunit Na+/H+ antiporter MnhB subunit